MEELNLMEVVLELEMHLDKFWTSNLIFLKI